MKNEPVLARRWVIPMGLAMALSATAGCDRQESGGEEGSSGSTEVLVQSKSGGPANQTVEYPDGTGGGAMTFTLDRGVSLDLPITFCTGFGTVLTVVGREGETQVDARVIELATMRDGEPLETSTVSGYRRTGDEDGRQYEELWQSQRNESVIRDGGNTRIVGTMSGQRFYATSDTAFGPPQPIDGGREFNFTLEARCEQ